MGVSTPSWSCLELFSAEVEALRLGAFSKLECWMDIFGQLRVWVQSCAVRMLLPLCLGLVNVAFVVIFYEAHQWTVPLV